METWKQPIERLRRGEDSTKMCLKEVGFKDERWMELAQGCVQWWALILVALILQVLLPKFYMLSENSNMADLYARGTQLVFRPGTDYINWGFCNFSHFLHANAEIGYSSSSTFFPLLVIAPPLMLYNLWKWESIMQ
jgi:hypothetical protein